MSGEGVLAGAGEVAGTWCWRGGAGAGADEAAGPAGADEAARADEAAAGGGVQVLFAGRGEEAARDAVFARLTGVARPVAWARQIHSAQVLAARAGECGEGDALVAAAGDGMALCVVTADCVPVLLVGGGRIAAVHAGWRGIVQGVVAAGVAALGAPPHLVRAWIGPAIGRCCYETGEDVAAAVVAASTPEIAFPGPAGRPHLDLQGAVRCQLAGAGVGVGVGAVTVVPVCTFCEAGRLHSYRREGKGRGRNHAFIWAGGI